MLKRVLGLVTAIGVLAVATALAQAPAPAPAAPSTPPPPAAPSAPPQGETPARSGGGGQKVGQTGNPDPGVTFLNVVENPHVRVLQVTLQPGAIRRPHVHNDVTFHMLVPVTGSLELIIEKEAPITTVPGQAYYMVKGQTHSFTNKTGAAVQVIELFIKPDPATAAAAPAAAPPPPAAAGATAPAPAPATPAPAPATPPPPK